MSQAPGLSEVLDEHWRHFASMLPPRSNVIDLGCGAGAVGRVLLAAAPQIEVTGVDIAQIPSSDEARLRLQSGVGMESLPFPDAVFEAAVSQYGYEYGDAELASKELARVLVPGAHFSFLIHHPQGPIVADMRRDRHAIKELCGFGIQAVFLSGDAKALAEGIAVLKREYPSSIVDYAERGLSANIGKDRASRVQVWKAVTKALAPELCMLNSFDFCRADVRDIHNNVEPLTKWFDVRPPTTLWGRSGERIALVVQGTRLPD